MATPNPEILLEIYKLHSELADRVSQRRNASNQFYIGVLSALFVLFSITSNKDLGLHVDVYRVAMFVSILGIVICLIWLLYLSSLRRLNTGKFRVLHELENQLPFNFFQKEWAFVSSKKHLTQSTIEKLVPFLFISLYTSMLVYSIMKLW